MKRINDLYEKIISLDSLREADNNARKGKAGSYGVMKHDENREQNLLNLNQTLLECQFKTSPYKTFLIKDPKEREIHCLPYFPDRIVHWAIMLQLEPVWMSIFTADTYSCIKNRGIHAAAKKLAAILRSDPDNTRYCLKMDIKKYYPSIDQEILINIIRRKIKCKRTLDLLTEIIHSIPSGVPIGNYISQYAANLYLSYFDHAIKEELQVKYYFRYCDDMIILAPDKDSLWTLFSWIRKYLSEEIRLTIKGNYQVFPVQSRGIDFVGYRFYHDHVMLRKRIKQNLFRKHFSLQKNNITGKSYKMGMASFMGWVQQPFASTRHLINTLKKA